MIVNVSEDSLVVLEPDNCHQLHVVAPMGVDVDRALQSSGMGSESPTGGVVLNVAQLRAAARAAATHPEWDAHWDAMVAYAETKGWVAPDGQCLIAHVERTADARSATQ